MVNPDARSTSPSSNDGAPPPRSPSSRPIMAAAGSTPAQCTICLMPITVRAVLDPCHHEFDLPCATSWSEKHNTCPNCREVYTRILFNITSETAFESKEVAAPPAEPNFPLNIVALSLEEVGVTLVMIIPVPGFFLVASEHPVDLVTFKDDGHEVVNIPINAPHRVQELGPRMMMRRTGEGSYFPLSVLGVVVNALREQLTRQFFLRMLLQGLMQRMGQGQEPEHPGGSDGPLAIAGPPAARTRSRTTSRRAEADGIAQALAGRPPSAARSHADGHAGTDGQVATRDVMGPQMAVLQALETMLNGPEGPPFVNTLVANILARRREAAENGEPANNGHELLHNLLRHDHEHVHEHGHEHDHAPHGGHSHGSMSALDGSESSDAPSLSSSSHASPTAHDEHLESPAHSPVQELVERMRKRKEERRASHDNNSTPTSSPTPSSSQENSPSPSGRKRNASSDRDPDETQAKKQKRN